MNSGLLSDIANANLNATVTFDTGPVTQLGVIQQLTLNSGPGGSATASALNNGYTAAIPEPSTGGMFAGLGLVMLSLGLKRIHCSCQRRRRQATEPVAAR